LNNLAEVIRLNENDPSDKKAQYFQKTRDGKQILRDVMRTHIPAEIADAEKQGFSAPDASWFKGESIEFVRRTLMDDRAHLYQLVDRDTVQGLVTEHLTGVQNRRLLIWSLLNIERMLTQDFGAAVSSAPLTAPAAQ
jgi:asparagine synthase (glutamine-hydrolysing)